MSGDARDPSQLTPPLGSGGQENPRLADLSDGELVTRTLSAAPGDTRAFDELVLRHQGHIQANCRFIAGDPDSVLDLAQEVFVKAFFSLSSFKRRSSFRTWLRRIKVNQCLSFRESRWNRPDLSLDAMRPDEDPALRIQSEAQERVEAGELGDRIVETLDRLPDNLRIPLVLRDMDGFSYEEITEKLGLGLSAVKMRILRGRKAFREAWNEEKGG